MRNSIKKGTMIAVLAALIVTIAPTVTSKAAEQNIQLVSDTTGAKIENGTIIYPAGTERATTCISFTLNKPEMVTLDREMKMCRALNPWYYDKTDKTYRDSAYEMTVTLSYDKDGKNIIQKYDSEHGPYFMPLADATKLGVGTYYYTISWSPAQEEPADNEWTAVSLNDVRYYWETYGYDYEGYMNLKLQLTDPEPSHTVAPYIGEASQEESTAFNNTSGGQMSSKTSMQPDDEDTQEDSDDEETVTIKWSKVKNASRYIVKKRVGKKWLSVTKTKKAAFAEAEINTRYQILAQKRICGKYKIIKKFYVSAQ